MRPRTGSIARHQVAIKIEPLEARRLMSVPGIVFHQHTGVKSTLNVGSFLAIAPATNLVASINWGDGATSTGKLKADGIVGIDEIVMEVDGTHAYRKAGTFAVHIIVAHSGPSAAGAVLQTFDDQIVVTSSFVKLNGTINGQYSLAPAVPDIGATYMLNGSGTVGDLAAVTASGTIKLPGFIARGRATGTLMLTGASPGDTLTLALTGPLERGFGPFPATLSYFVTAGTGAFAGLTGRGAVDAALSDVNQLFSLVFKSA